MLHPFVQAFLKLKKIKIGGACPVEKAIALLRRPFTGPGAEEIDRQITLAYRALAESKREEVLKLSAEGLQRFPESVGSEEFWNLRGFVAGAEDRGSPARPRRVR